MRPINKEPEAVELDHLFESYVETDLFQQLTTSVGDPSGSDDLAHLFDLPSSNENDLFGFTPILHRENEPWHKATQLGSQNPTSSSDSVGSSVNYSHLRGKSTSSDSDTLSFEDLFELERNQLRSTSQPSTPRPTTTTGTSTTSTTSKCIKKAQSVPSIPRGVQKSLKKCPSSSFAKTAKMMQPSYFRAPVPHMWARKMDSAVDLHAQVLPINMHSPPSTKIDQDECADSFFVQHHHSQPYTTTRSPMVEGSSPPDMGFSNYQLTPQASPAIGVSNGSDPFAQNMGLTYSSAASTAGLSAFTPPSSLRIPMTTWAPSDSPAMDFPFSTCPPDFTATKTAGWWPTDSMTTHPYPTARESHARTTQQSIPVSMAGLGISCDMTSFSDMDAYPPPDLHAYHPGITAARRKSSQSSHGRAPSQGSAGFVNFTPDDSRKILTGVAPSGSSKTKARREKEAAEKRRKLSLAAVKAVMEAGGDVERLRMLEMEGGF
ncbi:uncharacterized protein M421DRAFT_73748 [Didymella exigua CBS 183.55]|uniref:Developmental regulatory protein wetA n=1 Tax=Didymella exigua CBS 183.55 TaxID=1150837 RepID=A0A6A5R798_9PLEO|nr:uncharacterized protein M421DRAFT_73748 [Didymella exigua CBS 183.55]KAF1924051.1 hypothetical protein M421DRAFT_73748 [Didymella exigua CBS 183.55]